MNPRICIIGAGPSGLAAAISAVSLGANVDLIDPWNDFVNSNNQGASRDGIGESSIAKKNFRGSYEMYQYPEEAIIFQRKDSFPISLTRGGLTSVWGANSISWTQASDFLGNDPLHARVINLLSNYLSIESSVANSDSFASEFFEGVMRKSMSSAVEIYPSQIAYFAKKCVRCGECLLGCNYEAIFNAYSCWEKLISDKKVTLVRGFVNKVSDDGKVALIKYSHNQQEYSREYSKAFVACGPIASTALMMRSGLIKGDAILSDTQVFYTGFIKLRFKVRLETRFTLAHAYASIKHKNNRVHISLYEASDEAISRATSEIRFLPKSLSRIILRWVVPGIGFLPQKNSAQIHIKKIKDSKTGAVELGYSNNVKSRRLVKKLLLKNFFQFCKLGLVPFPFLVKVPNPGASYHVGALSFANSEIDSSKRIAKDGNVILVDSSALTTVPSGPITIVSMLNAGTIALKSIGGVQDE